MKLILRDLASTLDRLKRKYPTRGQDKQVTAPIHSLVQNFQSGSAEQGESVRWTRRPLYGTAMPLPGAEKAAGLLSSLPRTLAATIAGASRDPKGTAGSLDARPAVRLTFQAEDLALLHQVHDISHWVCSIDRTMVFDHGGATNAPLSVRPGPEATLATASFAARVPPPNWSQCCVLCSRSMGYRRTPRMFWRCCTSCGLFRVVSRSSSSRHRPSGPKPSDSRFPICILRIRGSLRTRRSSPRRPPQMAARIRTDDSQL